MAPSGVYRPLHGRKGTVFRIRVAVTHTPGVCTARGDRPLLPLSTLPPPGRRWIADGRYLTSSHELHAWLEGHECAISAEAASDHGMDLFWYTMLMRPWPTDDNLLALCARLQHLLQTKGPENVAKDVASGSLIKSLGHGFEWVVLPTMISKGPLATVTGWPPQIGQRRTVTP
jgi:hypothetical protein